MPALNFKAQFAGPVERGEKRQTIRARRKRPIRVEDRLYLYTGMRTKACRKLGESDCVSVEPIVIRQVEGVCVAVLVGGQLLTRVQAEHIAHADGFETLDEFGAFFLPKGGMFDGQLIKWGDLIS